MPTEDLTFAQNQRDELHYASLVRTFPQDIVDKDCKKSTSISSAALKPLDVIFVLSNIC